MDSIGVIGLVAGLWFALSPVDEQRRSATVWLGWLLAGSCTVLLLAGTLTEPLDPQGDTTVNSDWTTGSTPDSSPQSSIGGTVDPRTATPSASGPVCTPSCG